MDGKHLIPLLCIALIASSLPLWANPFVADPRDANKGSPIESFMGSREASIQVGGGIFAPILQTPTYDSPGGFGSLQIFPAPHIALLFQDCSAGPACLYGVGFMLSFSAGDSELAQPK